jgi:hypothetical protein
LYTIVCNEEYSAVAGINMATSRQGVKVEAKVVSIKRKKFPLLISQNWGAA